MIEEKIKRLFAELPEPPKSKPKPKKQNPYKFDNTYPCHEWFTTKPRAKMPDNVRE